MPVCSPEFREAITARMLPPNNESMNSLARETGVCLTTLRKWKQKALGEAALQERAEGRSGSLPSLSRKFRIAFESAGLSDEELAAYARSKGLHVEQIKEYRRDCLPSVPCSQNWRKSTALRARPWRSGSGPRRRRRRC